MSDTLPKITPSHSADESEGALGGISTPTLLWVSPLVVVALGFFVTLSHSLTPAAAALRTLVPALIVILVVRLLQQSGPPGFLRDRLEAVVNGGDAKPSPTTARVGSPLFTSFPDGWVAEQMILFGGLSGQVARGFWIDVPDLRNASFAERNRAQEAWSSVLRLLPEEWFLQVRAVDDHRELAPRLLEYARRTEACKIPTSRALRNANFIRLWKQLETGQMRLRRVTLWVGYKLPASGGDHSQLLASASAAFRHWELTLRQVLERVGTRVTALEQADVIRQWADALNPSLFEQRGPDPVSTYDPSASLLDNLWRSEVRGGSNPGFLLDGFLHLSLTVKRLPPETYFSITHELACLPFEGVTYTAQLRRIPKAPLLRQAQTKVERIHNQRSEKPNQKLAVSQEQLEAKIRRLSADGVVPLELELILVVRAKSLPEVLERAASVKAVIHRIGAHAFEASLAVSSRNLFLKTLPGWMSSTHRGYCHYVEDPTAADLLPLVSSFSGHPGRVESLFPGSDGGLVNIVSSLGEDETATPQNFVVVGAAGVGKSLAVNTLLIETAAEVGFTVVVESGLSQAPFSRALGIEPLVFKPDGTQTVNFLDTNGLPRSPFWLSTGTAILTRMIGIPGDEEKARRQHALVARELQRITEEHAEECLRRWPTERRDQVLRVSAAVSERIRQQSQPLIDAYLGFRELQHRDPAAAERELARFSEGDLRDHAHQRVHEVHDILYAHLKADEHLTLSSMRESLELSEEEECRWLAVLLTPWCQEGTHGRLFDGPTNVPCSPLGVHYELGGLPEGAHHLAAIIGFVALNTTRAKCQQLPRSLRKRVVIDEVSRFLDLPGGDALLRELFEGFRKYNVQVIILGQQYSRIADSPIRAAIMGNTRAWLIFNTGDARDIARLGADLGLTQLAQDAIGRFVRPDQQAEPKYSEFLYYHTAPQPICGSVRYFQLPTTLPQSNS